MDDPKEDNVASFNEAAAQVLPYYGGLIIDRIDDIRNPGDGGAVLLTEDRRPVNEAPSVFVTGHAARNESHPERVEFITNVATRKGFFTGGSVLLALLDDSGESVERIALTKTDTLLVLDPADLTLQALDYQIEVLEVAAKTIERNQLVS